MPRRNDRAAAAKRRRRRRVLRPVGESTWRVGDAAAITKERGEGKPPLYMRVCPVCGHYTASLDERLLWLEIECPECSAVTG